MNNKIVVKYITSTLDEIWNNFFLGVFLKSQIQVEFSKNVQIFWKKKKNLVIWIVEKITFLIRMEFAS